MTAKLKFTKEQVLDAYSGDRSVAAAAKVLGCGVSALTKLMREYGIGAKPKWRQGRFNSGIAQFNDREWLHNEFIVKGRTREEIADELGSTFGNVSYHLLKFGLIPRQTSSEATTKWLKEKYPNGRYGSAAAHWKGGRVQNGPDGYVRIWKPDHPAASCIGYVFEHRLVMEEKLGRYLQPGEVVDHIDLNKGNNHPDNLRLHPSRAAHIKDHFSARHELEQLRAELKRYREKYGPLDEVPEQIL